MTHSPQLLFLCLCVLSVFGASDGVLWRRRRPPLPQCERAFPTTAKSGIVHDCTYQCKGWPFRMGAEADGIPCLRQFGRVGHCLYGKCARGTRPWPMVTKTTAGRRPRTTKSPTTQHGPRSRLDKGKRKQKCKRAFPVLWEMPYVRKCRYLCLGFPLRMDTEFDGTTCLFQAWPRRTMGHCYNGVCKKGKQPTTTMTTGVTIGTTTTKKLRGTSTIPRDKSTSRMTTMAQTSRPTSFTKTVTTPYLQDSSSKFTISPGTIAYTEIPVTSPAQESTTSYSVLPSVGPEDPTSEPFRTRMVYSSSSTQSTRRFPATTGEGFSTSPFPSSLSTHSSVEDPYSQSSAMSPSTEDGRTLLTTKVSTEEEASTTSTSPNTKAEELRTPWDEFTSSTHSSVEEPSSNSSGDIATTEGGTVLFTTGLTTEEKASATLGLATSTVKIIGTTQFSFPSSTDASVEDSSSQSSRKTSSTERPQTFFTAELSTEESASSSHVHQTTTAQEFSTSHDRIPSLTHSPVEESSSRPSAKATTIQDELLFFTTEPSTKGEPSSTDLPATTKETGSTQDIDLPSSTHLSVQSSSPHSSDAPPSTEGDLTSFAIKVSTEQEASATQGDPIITAEDVNTPEIQLSSSTRSSVDESSPRTSVSSTEDGLTFATKISTEEDASSDPGQMTTKAVELTPPLAQLLSSTHSPFKESSSQYSAVTGTPGDGVTLFITKESTEKQASDTPGLSTTTSEIFKTSQIQFSSSTHSPIEQSSSRYSADPPATEDGVNLFTAQLFTEEKASSAPDLPTIATEEFTTPQP